MRLLPVMDIRNGIVVQGIAGRREDYRPIVSCLTDSTQPLIVARALLDRTAASELYVADLDAIGSGVPNRELYAELARLPVRVLLDAGVCTPEEADQIAAFGLTPILGLETWSEPMSLRDAPRHSVFSLDLHGGRPLAWGDDPLRIAEAVIAAGLRRLIVLDLSRVGLTSGPGTSALCAELARRYPGVTLIAGGGVRSRAAVDALQHVGVTSVLVASALHRGELP